MFEFIKVMCANCSQWNRHILRKKTEDIVTFCKKCGEIDLIIDNTFIKEYLKNNI